MATTSSPGRRMAVMPTERHRATIVAAALPLVIECGAAKIARTASSPARTRPGLSAPRPEPLATEELVALAYSGVSDERA